MIKKESSASAANRAADFIKAGKKAYDEGNSRLASAQYQAAKRQLDVAIGLIKVETIPMRRKHQA